MRTWKSSAVLSVLVAFGVVLACSSAGKPVGDDAANQAGFCADSCPRDCALDSDCDASKGQLCCDLGPEDGRACMDAEDCPRTCQDDSRCDTDKGEACLRTFLQAPQSVCVEPEKGIHLCSNDAACAGDEKCCTLYKEPLCLKLDKCPQACSRSDECNTAQKELCCTTLSLTDPTLQAKGVCINPEIVDCPKACTRSVDCDTRDGELCCNGICSKHCDNTCQTSNDCPGQLCCKSKAVHSPYVNKPEKPGIEGTPAGDFCETKGLYDDGKCNESCPKPDPDCGGTGGTGGTAGSSAGGGNTGSGGVVGNKPCGGIACSDPSAGLLTLLSGLEGGTTALEPTAGRDGSWFIAKSAGATVVPSPFAPTCGGARNSCYSACIEGTLSGANYPYAAVGFDFTSTSSPYDLSKYAGIQFYVSATLSAGAYVRFSAPTSASLPPNLGGTCTGTCYDYFGSNVTTTAAFQKVQVPFSSLKQRDFGTPAVWDAKTVHGVQWGVHSSSMSLTGTYKLCVDEVTLY